ncbi:MAG: GNAT family N-acetyltransferase [Planctomycetota bacterium]|nr:GNAT family N-acetyltransferase [Planctomycetota bacterium]MDA1113397.1 GNAT family N-acetyltransferase [Planctomycetota bacterium]
MVALALAFACYNALVNPDSAFASFSSEPAPALTCGPVPDFEITSGDYRVRFASTKKDLEEICRLRYRIFNVELGEGLDSANATGLDEDRFDAQCQHLLVEHLSDGHPVSIVGTYRLQTAETAQQRHGFYSAVEFDLSGLPAEMLSDAVELGRACVCSGHRNRRTLFLLWKGLAAYVLWHQKRYFFGCNSLTSESRLEGWRMMRFLTEHGHVHPEFLVDPQRGYECETPASLVQEDEMTLEIPPLFGIYLRYGAKVCGPPAHDALFHTVDFFTVVDLNEMDERTFQNFASKK